MCVRLPASEVRGLRRPLIDSRPPLRLCGPPSAAHEGGPLLRTRGALFDREIVQPDRVLASRLLKQPCHIRERDLRRCHLAEISLPSAHDHREPNSYDDSFGAGHVNYHVDHVARQSLSGREVGVRVVIAANDHEIAEAIPVPVDHPRSRTVSRLDGAGIGREMAGRRELVPCRVKKKEMDLPLAAADKEVGVAVSIPVGQKRRGIAPDVYLFPV